MATFFLMILSLLLQVFKFSWRLDVSIIKAVKPAGLNFSIYIFFPCVGCTRRVLYGVWVCEINFWEFFHVEALIAEA